MTSIGGDVGTLDACEDAALIEGVGDHAGHEQWWAEDDGHTQLWAYGENHHDPITPPSWYLGDHTPTSNGRFAVDREFEYVEFVS